MINTGIKVTLLLSLLLPLFSVAQDNDVKAGINIGFQQDQEIWVGQQVTVNLDLKTTGLSFSDTHFNLPEVSGAFLMQTDTTTIKFSENTDGETWQIIRYPLALYPQKAGQLEIPPITVRFNTSTGFGSAKTAFEFQTKPLQIAVKLPPGVKEGALLVTTASFKLDHDWQPGSGTAKTGDAFTLTVRRRANDTSAMLLPPLPVFRVEGLAAYPQAPEVNDKTNRGDLTGERIDSIIWVAEKPGNYNIPGIRFQWWDSNSRELKQQTIPGLILDVQPSLMDERATGTIDKPVQSGINQLWLLAAGMMVFLAAFLWYRFGLKASDLLIETEKSAFASLQKACKSNNAPQTHSALYSWLAWSNPRVILSDFAQARSDTLLRTELEQLQEALVSTDNNWQGDKLLASLQRTRRNINKQKTLQSKASLAPLNPYKGQMWS